MIGTVYGCAISLVSVTSVRVSRIFVATKIYGGLSTALMMVVVGTVRTMITVLSVNIDVFRMCIQFSC